MEFIGEEKDRTSWALHFAQVKANIKQPQRSHTVQVSGKTKAGKPYTYEYKYADLADVDKSVMDAIKNVVDDKGAVQFSYFFDVNNTDQGVDVRTVLVDITGFCAVTNKVWFKNFNVGDAQKTASLISYAKRYSLSAAFGIASEDDDDAQDIKTIEEPKVLSKRELDNYTVYYNGLKANLADLYQEAVDGMQDAQEWIRGSHTPQDAQAIHQLNQIYKQREKNKQEALKKAEEEAKREEDLREKQQREQEDVSNLFGTLPGEGPKVEQKYFKEEVKNGQKDV